MTVRENESRGKRERRAPGRFASLGETPRASRNARVCVLMLLYIVKGFGVLVWLVRGGDGLDPEGGASFEFG